MTTAMRVEMDGFEILPDECTRSQGWKTASERVRLKGAGKPSLNPVLQTSQKGAGATADVNSRRNNLGDGATGSDTRPSRAKRINKGKLLKCACMPDLPCGDIKIALRPRGGFHVSDVTGVELSRDCGGGTDPRKRSK
ncbi:hypothetical protein MTO96_043678 [Rhipicephalus appendiculatus]